MTNLELANTMKSLATTYRTHYSLGGCLQLATEENKRVQLARFDNGTARRKQIEGALPNEYLGDCNCSIKSIVFWGFNFKDGGHPGSDKDFTTEEMIERCTDVSTDFSSVLVGELVHKTGHLGVIVEVLPDGRIITAECNERWGKEGMMLTACNCNIEGLNTQNWELHGRIPEVTYCDYIGNWCDRNLAIRKGDINPGVKLLQEELIELGYSCGPDGADGQFGNNTEAAVKAFQSDLIKTGAFVDASGIADFSTLSYLIRR